MSNRWSGNTLHDVPSHVFAQKSNTSWVYIDPLHYPSFSRFFPTFKFLDFPFLLISPHHSGHCRNWELPKRSRSRRSVILQPRVGLFTYTSNFRSPGIEGSQGLIKQIPSNLVPFESYGPGEYVSAGGIEGFGEFGGVRRVRCCFYSFSIFTYLFPSFLHHFPINPLHSFCPLAGLRPIFTSYDFHVLF